MILISLNNAIKVLSAIATGALGVKAWYTANAAVHIAATGDAFGFLELLILQTQALFCKTASAILLICRNPLMKKYYIFRFLYYQ